MEFRFIRRLILKRFWNISVLIMHIHRVPQRSYDLLILRRVHLDPKRLMKLFWILEYHIWIAIDVLLYLAQYTNPDIAFAVNLLARYSFTWTRRNRNDIKYILHYLCETNNLRLFIRNVIILQVWLGIPILDTFWIHISYIFKLIFFSYNGTTVSWRSIKQTLVAISSNHAEIFVLHKNSRECIWLRSVI